MLEGIFVLPTRSAVVVLIGGGGYDPPPGTWLIVFNSSTFKHLNRRYR